MGEENTDPQNDPENTDPENDPKDPPKDKAFTQAQVNRISAREKDEGRRAGKRELLEELGLEDADTLKEMVAAHKTTQESQKSDLQKAEQDRDKAKRDAEEAKAEAKQVRFDSKVKDMLLEAGIPAKSARRVAGMLNGLTAESDDDAITEEIEALQEDFPNLFGEQEEGGEDPQDDQGGAPPRSDPGRMPKTPPKSGNAKERATSLLHERHPRLVKP